MILPFLAKTHCLACEPAIEQAHAEVSALNVIGADALTIRITVNGLASHALTNNRV